MITEEKETLLRRFKFLIEAKRNLLNRNLQTYIKKMKASRRELELPNIFSDPRATRYKPHVYIISIIILQIMTWN